MRKQPEKTATATERYQYWDKQYEMNDKLLKAFVLASCGVLVIFMTHPQAAEQVATICMSLGLVGGSGFFATRRQFRAIGERYMAAVELRKEIQKKQAELQDVDLEEVERMRKVLRDGGEELIWMDLPPLVEGKR